MGAASKNPAAAPIPELDRIAADLHLQLAAAEHVMLGRGEKQAFQQVRHCPLGH
jgi:hypothetical protein